MGLDGFKQRLAEANNARRLDLSRADMVEAMDPDDVAALGGLLPRRTNSILSVSDLGEFAPCPTDDRTECNRGSRDGPAPPADPPADPRIAAFCSAERPEVFHAVAYRNDIWKEDPFDVETIHEEARDASSGWSTARPSRAGAAAGRILLLEGEAGSGKTHLMRAFRNWTHRRGRGYFGYMQMTSATDHYGRYVLNNLIDSLDQPYYEPRARPRA